LRNRVLGKPAEDVEVTRADDGHFQVAGVMR
jgi:hypothetical protein